MEIYKHILNNLNYNFILFHFYFQIKFVLILEHLKFFKVFIVLPSNNFILYISIFRLNLDYLNSIEMFQNVHRPTFGDLDRLGQLGNHLPRFSFLSTQTWK